jgi:transcriptional regulator with XRE-family HTH domain
MTARPQPEGAVLGARLREMREERGETQRSLADAAGFSQTYIANMERGLKVPSLTTLLRLAVALECEVVDLVDVFSDRDLRNLIQKRK